MPVPAVDTIDPIHQSPALITSPFRDSHFDPLPSFGRVRSGMCASKQSTVLTQIPKIQFIQERIGDWKLETKTKKKKITHSLEMSQSRKRYRNNLIECAIK